MKPVENVLVNLSTVEQLAGEWREEAKAFRRRGAIDLANAVESFAVDLETRLREWQLETLTLEEAAEESGYSYSALSKKIANGELSNAGEKHKPRVVRAELPRKGGKQSTAPALADAVLAGRRNGLTAVA